MAEISTAYSRFGSPSTEPRHALHIMNVNFSFKNLGRRASVATVVLLGGIPFIPPFAEYFSSPVDFAVHLSMAVAMGILELPFCCTIVDMCRRIQILLSPFEVYWRRGLLYWIFGGVMSAIHSVFGNRGAFTAWFLNLLVYVCGLLYILCFINGESATSTSDNVEKATSGESSDQRFMPTANIFNAQPAPFDSDEAEKEKARLQVEIQRAALKAAMTTRL